jgi:hypothetical protein
LIVGIETLKKMAEQNNNANYFCHRCQCHNCGCDIEIKITKTSGGCGLQGGVLYQPNDGNLSALCVDCYLKSGEIKHSQTLCTDAREA